MSVADGSEVDEPSVLGVALARALDPLTERPRLVPSAEIAIGETRWGETYAIVTGHGSGPYLRVAAEAGRLALTLDGARSLAEITRDTGVDPIDAVEAVDMLRANRVVEGGGVDVYAALARQTLPRWRRAMGHLATGIRRQTLEVPGMDRAAGGVYRAAARRLFTPAAAAGGAALAIVGLAAFVAVVHGNNVHLSARLSGATATAIVLALFASVAIHEFGHALAVKHAGRSVNRAGLQLYLGHPAFFVDSTDLLFASRRQRVLNAVVGLYVDAVVAGAAALVAWTWSGTDVGLVAGRVAVLTYVSIVLNLVPFLELDGYWLLTDLIDTPRLRQRSLTLLRSDVPRRLRGRRDRFDRRERLMIGFGVLGVLFGAVALATAWAFWWPLVAAIGSALGRAGAAGRVLLAALVLVAIGPFAEVGVKIVRAVALVARRAAADLRFRLQTGWRVEAAKAIARLHGDQSMDEDTLGELAGLVRRRRVTAGESLVTVGEGGHHWFVVRRGRLEVLDPAGHVLNVLVAGEAFGEAALLHRGPRTASVRAVTDGEVFVLDAGAYLRLVAPAIRASAGAVA